MFEKVQKRSLPSNVTFNTNVALGSEPSQTYGFFSPVFLTYESICYFISGLRSLLSPYTISGLQKLSAVGGWEKYGLTVQIKYPLTTNDSFIG